MRIAFISDIHGHFQALEAALDDIKKSNIQSIICLGDVLSLGMEPRKVIDLLQTIDCQFIMGNHDEPFIDYAQLGMLSMISEEIYNLNRWTLSQLSDSNLDFIRTFKKTIKIEDPRRREILCFHGLPQCNHNGIFPETPEETINTLLSGHTAVAFVSGHTHKQMMRTVQGRLIANPGSIGYVFYDKIEKGQEPVLLPWAEYGILDLSGADITFEMKKIPFDVQAIRKVIAKTDIPYRGWWEKQYSW